jgi:Domain of unknown function (DUF6597)/Protein of unknown function (DUF3313)
MLAMTCSRPLHSGHMHHVPGLPLSEFVALLWHYRGDEINNTKERVLPTGSVDLIIRLDSARTSDSGMHGPRTRLRAACPPRPVYDRLLIEAVQVSYDEMSSYRGLKPQQVARLNAAVVEAIRAAVGDRFTLVSEPGPGVLRVGPAIVDL